MWVGVSRKQRARDIRAGLWGAVEGGRLGVLYSGCAEAKPRRCLPGAADRRHLSEAARSPKCTRCLFRIHSLRTPLPPAPLQRAGTWCPAQIAVPALLPLGAFPFLGYLGWRKALFPPPHPHLLFSLTPQMKFQHMSPDIIPLRLRITLPTDTVFCPGLLAPKCLPKRLGPLLEGLSLPWANSEYL